MRNLKAEKFTSASKFKNRDGLIFQFLGAFFAKLRKTTISFVMFVCPNVRPAPTGRMSMKFYTWVFIENLLGKFKCH